MQHSSETGPPVGTALVLGGGGSAGNAWLLGVVAGLVHAGVPVTDADLIVGTSAGATAAAQLVAADPATLLSQILDTPVPARPAGRGGQHSVSDHLARTSELIAASSDVADMRRRIGAHAIGLAESDPAARDRWRAVVASRLPDARWPQRRLLLTAVDAETGAEVVLDRDSGVDLVDAVAASTSGGAAYRLGGRSLIDGGYRTNADNADLASGCAVVLVLSPLGGRSRTPAGWGLHLESQVQQLRSAGSDVVVLVPDEAALAAFGDNLMDPSTRPPAARAGYDQGRSSAAPVDEVWRTG